MKHRNAALAWRAAEHTRKGYDRHTRKMAFFVFALVFVVASLIF